MSDHRQGGRLVPSDEGDAKGLELGRAQGAALTRTIEHMTGEIAHDGREVRSGDYLIAFAVEEAEGMYVMRGGDLVWEEPGEENVHLEIAVRDVADGRLIPALEVDATLCGPDGAEVGTHRMPLLWHPYLYHYGRNWRVPGDGVYTLRVRFNPPTFPRHDRENGRRFLDAGDVTFDNVRIRTGQD